MGHSRFGKFDEPYVVDPARAQAIYQSERTVFFGDDFLGANVLQAEAGSEGLWEVVEVALNAGIDTLDGENGGVVRLAMDADVNAEDAVLYWNDVRGMDVSKRLLFECRARLTVLPTLTGQVVFGMAGDHDLDKDAITEAAWFKFDGSGAALAESDDTTNNNDDVATSVTATTSAWHVYQIDFNDLSDVKFYIDGKREASGTKFDMSNLSAAEALMQPYISLDKGADAGVGTFDVDYVKIWCDRE